MDKLKNNISRKVLGIVFIFSILSLFSLFIILFTPLTELLYKPLIIDETPSQSDAIVILSFDAFDTATGLPDLSTFARLHKGLQLYRAGYAKELICVGGNRLKSSGKSFAMLMKDFLLLYGVPSDHIKTHDDIEGDWNYYHNLMALTTKYDLDFNRTIIVTSPQNTYRIKKSFLKKNFNPTLVSSEKYALYPNNWHTRFETFRDIANEYWAIILFFLLNRI